MYRVMIVDDEQLIRITLKNMLDWKDMDCSILALAKDGEEAWKIYQEFHPEIVITDLKMPKMDGIELIRRIKETDDNTQVIALSNHADFELVKEAMKAGAFDYLLKVTLEEQELMDVITQVKSKCKVYDDTSTSRFDAEIERLQHYLIMQKNDHQVSDHDLESLFSSPFFEPYRQGYTMGYFRIDNIGLYYKGNTAMHDMLKRNLQDLISETIPNYMSAQLVFITNHSGIILFQVEEKLRILNTCNHIMRNISQYLDIQLSITLSEEVHDVLAMLAIFEGLLERHDMRFYVGEGILIQAEELPIFNRLQIASLQFHADFLEAVSARDFKQLDVICESFMTYMKQNFIRPNDVVDYAIFILNNMEGNELAKGIKTSFPFHDVIDMIHQCETIDKLDEIMRESFQLIETWLMDSGSNRYRQDITEIIDYVEQNYTQKITLKMVAEKFNINESYLSRMFKSETGKNLIYFINEHKMKKARELLCDPSIMVKEAAYAVGIEDQFYFNKVFKKFFDISPSEFRKRMIAKDVQDET